MKLFLQYKGNLGHTESKKGKLESSVGSFTLTLVESKTVFTLHYKDCLSKDSKPPHIVSVPWTRAEIRDL